MPYCPGCDVEYRPGFAECSDCHVTLVDEPLAGKALCSDRVIGAADAVFPVLYGIASLACFMMAFILTAGDPAPGVQVQRTSPEYYFLWLLGGCVLLLIAFLLFAFQGRQQPRL